MNRIEKDFHKKEENIMSMIDLIEKNHIDNVGKIN
jgi:hypothetical protein